MNSISFKLISFLLGMTALTVVSSTGSARAETPSTNSSYGGSTPTAVPMPADASTAIPMTPVEQQMANSTPPVEQAAPIYAPLQTAEPAAKPTKTVDPLATHPSAAPIPEQTLAQPLAQPQAQQANLPELNSSPVNAQKRQSVAMGNDQSSSPEVTAGASAANAMPPQASTSAAHLIEQPQAPSQPELSSEQVNTNVAQSLENVEPGRATQGGRSYIGIGGNVGLSGGTGIGKGGFLINSKIGLTRNISVRPSVIIGDSTDFLIPITYDLVLESADPFQPIPFAPFIGGGVAFTTESNNDVGFLLTGGADFPLSKNFVANATVNAGFYGDTTSIGIGLGVGYQFSGF